MPGNCNLMFNKHYFIKLDEMIYYNSIGWENDSWGYHGDDGHLHCSGSGKPYGPSFTTGDTIGCCLNYMNNTVFYTKNGVNLGNDYLSISLF